MINLNQKYQRILSILLKNNNISSSEVFEILTKAGEKISLVTVKRLLSDMAKNELLEVKGAGRSTVYSITALGRINTEVDAEKYCRVEPDKRFGLLDYNFSLLPVLQDNMFSEADFAFLEKATTIYRKATEDISESIRKKELERLTIELSWKSSKIEGNTYTLLDTEKLIRENKPAPGKSRQETQMILNHKEAFDHVYRNAEDFKALTRKNLEELHSILVKDLDVSVGLRKKPVGVLGSIYRPLDNVHQITEAIELLASVISRVRSPYAKAFFALIGIAYVQPFDDGNKRTSRLMANALLLSNGLVPLSYRSVDEEDYREAMLVFYELNSVLPIKRIFMEQYDFAARNYAAK